MNPEEKAFLDAILAEPEEDTPRLAYADWLDEAGHPLYAKMIRLHVTHARSKPGDRDKTSGPTWKAFKSIARKATKGNETYHCISVLRLDLCFFRFCRRGSREPFLTYTFERGICTRLKCTWGFWHNHWEQMQVTPALPIRKVELTDCPQGGYSFTGSRFHMTFDQYSAEKWPEVEFTIP